MGHIIWQSERTQSELDSSIRFFYLKIHQNLNWKKENVSRLIYFFVFSAAINFLADITTDDVSTIPAPSKETQFALRSQNQFLKRV